MAIGKSAKQGTKIPGLKSTKTRQYLTVGALSVALYAAFYLIFVTADKKPSKLHVKGDVETTHVNAPGEHLDPREAWIGGAGKELAEMQERMIKQDQLNEKLQQRLNDLQERVTKDRLREAERASKTGIGGVAVKVDEPLETEPVVTVQPSANSVFPPASPAQVASALSNTPAPAPTGGTGWFKGQGTAVQPAVNPPVTRALGQFRLEPVKTGEGKDGENSSSATKAAERLSGETFLPVGLVKATLIGGIDAPTGGQAQSQPLPVMLKIGDLAVLPNHFRANVKECFAVGAAYGELSAERAYARIELLSCIRHDGEVLETPVHGVVYDETGKLGMRGYVRTKQGQILANALLSGVIGGIGRGFAMSATDTSTSVLGTVSNVSGSDAYRAGVGQGVGRALDRLADYYIRLAEQLFPVIEVHGGRSVDIAFTKGIRLPVPLPENRSLAMGYYDED
ncbi:MAG: TraB/VirB10 family protein [Azonexus sp.]|jgi:conjugal transfer pilus assembly protein TraB|nr:TraB/VirB10 family protein [Azonexus sp.]